MIALSVTTISCSKKEVGEEPTQIEFQLGQDGLIVKAEGGIQIVEYTIKNPIEGINPVPECKEAEWISDFSVEESKIQFMVASNDNAEARKATVNIIYGKYNSSFTVYQAGKNGESVDINMEIKEIGPYNASFCVNVNAQEQPYMVGCVPKEYMDTYGNDENKFIQDDLKYWEQKGADQGKTLEEVLSEELFTGNIESHDIRGLKPKNKYCLFAYSVDYTGNIKSGLFRLYFETAPVEKLDITFQISYTIDVGNVCMSVIPSDMDQRYYFGYFGKTDLGNMNLEEAIQASFDLRINVGASLGMSVEEVLDKILVTGSQTKTLELNAEKEYIGYSVAVDDAGNICSNVASKDFTTGTPPRSDNNITINIENISVDQALVTTQTTNNDPYVFLVLPADNFKNMDNSSIIKKILSEYTITESDIFIGNQNLELNGLIPDTEYIAVAFGYVIGTSNTDLFKSELKTAPAGDPSNMTFNFIVSDIGINTAKINVTGNPANAGFYFDIIPASMTENEIKTGFQEEIKDYISSGQISSPADYWRGLLSRGEDSFEYTSLSGDTEYKVYAFGVNESTGEIASSISFSEIFRTSKREISSSSIELVFDKYFDADELSIKYPDKYDEFKNQGLYCLPISVKTTGNISATFFAAFTENLMDKQSFTDDMIIHNLVDLGNGTTTSEMLYFLPYDTDCTILAVAKDVMGHYTEVYRALINNSETGISPIDDFATKGRPSELPGYGFSSKASPFRKCIRNR